MLGMGFNHRKIVTFLSRIAQRTFLLKPLKLSYHGLPFAFHDSRDIIADISRKPQGGLHASPGKNLTQSEVPEIKTLRLFYVDAYYDFEKSSWFTG